MPYAAPTRCTDPSCPNMATYRGRCEDHQRPAWQGQASKQDRYGQSGGAMATLHKRILRRDGYVCYRCGLPGADEVDHVIEVADGGSRTSEANLAAIHHDPCHLEKTAEAKRARAERRKLEREQRDSTLE